MADTVTPVTEEEIAHRVAEGDVLMSTREVANLIGGDPPTSDRWVLRNMPSPVLIGRKRDGRPIKVRWWRSTVVRWLAEAHKQE